MLVLFRKINDTIQIGDDITITVLGIKSRSIRLGVEAPSGTRVLRGELIDAVTPNDAQDLAEYLKSNTGQKRGVNDAKH